MAQKKEEPATGETTEATPSQDPKPGTETPPVTSPTPSKPQSDSP
jgi:hypothetical protein